MPPTTPSSMFGRIRHELKHHAPFTLVGALVGAGVLLAILYSDISQETSGKLFAVFHPLHVFLSAIASAGLYRLYAKGGVLQTLLVGAVSAVAVGTLSDSLIPYLGELLFGAVDEQVHAHAHIGIVEWWWVVAPAAIAGSLLGFVRPKTTTPHAGHVLLSTAASLFHMAMALESGASLLAVIGLPVFLFLAVWVPCCTSDIVLPLLLVPRDRWPACEHCHSHTGDTE